MAYDLNSPGARAFRWGFALVVLALAWWWVESLKTQRPAPTDAWATYYVSNATVEPSAHITPLEGRPPRETEEAIEAAVTLVRAGGYRCDSISSFARDGSRLRLYCNGFAYRYTLEDRGGRINVREG